MQKKYQIEIGRQEVIEKQFENVFLLFDFVFIAGYLLLQWTIDNALAPFHTLFLFPFVRFGDIWIFFCIQRI